MHRERLDIATANLAELAASGVDAGEIASAAALIWQSIHTDLSRIIGHKGVCALYQRSLYLAQVDFPWLEAVHDTALHPGEFDGLSAALSQHSATVGAAANNLLLETFCDLLSSLIGDSLTARLLGTVLDNNLQGT